MAVAAVVPKAKAKTVLVSHTGVALTREVACRFALNPTQAQQETLFRCAGAARFVFSAPGSRVL